MTQLKHTPGPWTSGTAKNEYADWCEVKDQKGNHICSVEGLSIKTGRWNSRRADKANAYLIAAAPDLLEAAEELIAAREARNGDDFLNGKFFRLQEAVNKAKGVSNGN